MNKYPKFTEVLNSAITAAKLSPAVFAGHVGVEAKLMDSILIGSRKPDCYQIRRMADFLNLDRDELFWLANPWSPRPASIELPATVPADASEVPAHYAGAVTPWDLERSMQSSGNAFVDARRTDVIEYAFRLKGDLLGDLKKARHCLDEAIRVLSESTPQPTLQP